MKKVCCFLAIMLSLFLMDSIVALADADEYHGIKELINNAEQEVIRVEDQIYKIMKKEMMPRDYTIKTPEGDVEKGEMDICEYDSHGSFKSYVWSAMTPAKEGGSIQSALDGTYTWNIPAKMGNGWTSIVMLKEVDGQLKWSANKFGEGVVELLPDYEKLIVAVKNSDEIEGQLISAKILYAPLYNSYYFYLCSKDEEYIVPYYFIERFNEIGLEKYKVYRAMDLVDMYYDYYDETKYSDSDEIMYGGVPIREKTYWGYIVCVSCILAGLLALTIFSIKRRKKRGLF